MLTLAVLAIVIVVVAPSAQPEGPVRLLAAATMFAADIEYAQSASLAHPEDPTIVQFHPDGGGYWLALASAPDTPITRPNSTESYETIYGIGHAQGFAGLTAALVDPEISTLQFDGFGRLTSIDDQVVRLSSEAGEMFILVRATTGSVFISATPP